MATIKTFEELEIWKLSRQFVLKIYKLTSKPAISKDFIFRDQIRRSAASVMDNIAEGFERDSRLEFINFLSIAKGSCGEVISQIIRGSDLEYFSLQETVELKDGYRNLSGKIANFIQYLNQTTIKGNKFKDRN
jgi:four helix bundle protein